MNDRHVGVSDRLADAVLSISIGSDLAKYDIILEKPPRTTILPTSSY